MSKVHIKRFDLSATLNRIVTESLRLLNADRSALFLLDSETDSLTIEASIGLSERYLKAVSDRWKVFPVGRLIQDRGLLSSVDVQLDQRFLPVRDEIQAEGFRSIIVVPLVFEDASLGTLGFYFDEVRELSAEEKETVQTFGDLAAVAIENARALEEIRSRSERQEALRKVMRHITQDLDLSALFSRICRSVSELLRLTYVHVFILDEKSETFILAGSFGETVGGEGDYAVLPLGKGLLSRVLDRREPVVVKELLKEPDWIGHEWAERAGVRTFLGIPLLQQDRLVGVLSCFSTEVRDFRPDEIELIQDFADQAEVALENAKAFESLKEKTNQVARLNEINRKLTSTLDLKEILKSIFEASQELAGVRNAVVFLSDEAEAGLLIPHKESLEFSWGGVSMPRIRIGEGLTGWVAEHRAPEVVPNPQRDSRWVVKPWNEHLSLGAFAGLPLVSQGKLLGVVSFFVEEGHSIREEDFMLLSSFADQAAIAIEKARLFTEAQNRATNLEVLNEIAKAVNSTLDLGDLFKISVEQVKRLVPCTGCALYAVDEADKKITDFWVTDDDGQRREWLKAHLNLAGSQYEEIFDTKKVFYTPDTRKSPHKRLISLADKGLLSIVTVPILSEGKCIGVLNVGCGEVDAYSKDHVDLLGSVADHLALAMMNAELYGKVRETGEFLDNFVRGATDGIITVDMEGRITFWNPGAEVIYGYTKEEMIGHKILEAFPEGKEQVFAAWKRMVSGEIFPPMEMIRRRKDGKSVEVLITMSPIKDVKGRMVGTSGIHRDVGTQKRAEEALRNSERRYRSLFEQASDAILIGDPDGRFLDCNQHACELLGYTRGELLEKTILDVVASETLETFPKRLSQLREKDVVLNNENVFLRKDGSRIQAEVTTGLIDLEGEKCIMCLVRDITERERTRAMILRSEKLAAIGRMTAGTAHEILNPANIIGMHAQMLKDRGGDPATIQKSANSIYKNVKRIAKICDSLRRFSREEISAVTRFDLVTLLKEIVAMVEPQARIENVTLSVDAPQESLFLEADRDQILQVLLNLIGNARDAMPNGGHITLSAKVSLRQGSDWVRLSVTDEGMGIPEEQVSRIFDPFYTTKGVDKGTGLGLSIVHGIVENLSGRIDVKSEVNSGSVFVIELPAVYSGAPKVEKVVPN